MKVGDRVLPNRNSLHWANAFQRNLDVSRCPGTIKSVWRGNVHVQWDDGFNGDYALDTVVLLETGLDVMLRESFGES